MDQATLEKLAAPIVKMVWDSVIHPELQKLEATIGNAALQAIVAALDPLINAQVDAALTKMAQG